MGFYCRVAAVALWGIGAVPPSDAGYVKVAESNQPKPAPHSTNSFFEITQSPTINSEGQLAFYTDLRNNGFLQGFGLFLADPAGVKTIARSGDPAPDQNGNFKTFNSQAALNSSNQVFEANLQNTLGGGSDDSGLFQLSNGVLTQIARAGQPSPDNGGDFGSFQAAPFCVNAAGQVAFIAPSRTRTDGV